MSAKPAEIVSCAEFARRLDCDESTVRRYVREGKICAPAVAYKPTGKVAGLSFELAKRHFLEAREVTEFRFALSGGAPTGTARNRAAGRAAAGPVSDTGQPVALAPLKRNSEGLPIGEMAELRRYALQLKVELAELELGVLLGELLPRRAVYQALFEKGQEVRIRLEAIPHRIIEDMLAADNSTEALALLNKEIDCALKDVANILVRALAVDLKPSSLRKNVKA
ncbi:hypothetical protein ACVWYF_003941 [Hymenobacter sp. UYAg731]